ncbi:MAG TPA: site-2 protease family protein [Mycobacteriales bacterium]|nr:site-2 protease family protein [Mycobacteriales bacterium]
MANVLGIVLISAMLVISIALHEAGHLVTAKHYGMKVTQYFIGFGPKIFSFRRGETEYGLKAIPAGGFCKIVGMTPLEGENGEAPSDMRAAGAAAKQMPTRTEPDGRRLFLTFPARQRVVVLVAGSTMHFLLAIGLTFGALAIGGNLTHDPGPSLTVQLVSPCVQIRSDGSCPAGAAPSPAKKAGLRPGDVITAVNSRPVADWVSFSTQVKASAGKTLAITVQRAGQPVTLSVTPQAASRVSPSGGTATVGFVGISPGYKPYPTYNPLQAAAHTPAVLGTYITGTFTKLDRYPRSVAHLIEGKQRTSSDLAGVVDIARIGGDITSAPQPTRVKAGDLLLIGASVNFFVGVFNLLPLLPLDGGHVAIIGFENLRAWLARRRGRPDPGRVNPLTVLPVAYVVVAVFVGLSLLLVYAGFFNPIQGT